MELVIKRPPHVSDSEQRRIVQDIYDELNKIVNAVNQKASFGPTRQTEGKSGDLRLVKNADNDYYIEARFNEGWVSTVKGAMKFQDRQGAINTSPTITTSSGGVTITGNVLERPNIEVSGGGGGGGTSNLLDSGAHLDTVTTAVARGAIVVGNSTPKWGRVTIGANGTYVGSNGTDTVFKSILASEITSGAALTKVDDTNVTLTLGGTPATALLLAASLTLGWTGTLAAGRLNSNVVQAVTNDTNVTGSIAAQNLTLGWTGTLADGRIASASTWNAKVGPTRTISTVAPLSGGGDLSANRTLTTSISTNVLVGRYSAGSGVMQEITLGGNFDITGGTLDLVSDVSDTEVVYSDGSNYIGSTDFAWDNAAKQLRVGTSESNTGSLAFSQIGNPGYVVLSVINGDDGAKSISVPSNNGTIVVAATSPLSVDITGVIAITVGALTKVDDTNVTLTLGGSPTTSLLAATSLTLGWTGTLAVGRGGTGVGSLSNILGTTNQISVSGGTARVIGGNVTLSTPQDIHTSATPQFSRLGLGTAADSTAAFKGQISNSALTPVFYLRDNAVGNNLRISAKGTGTRYWSLGIDVDDSGYPATDILCMTETALSIGSTTLTSMFNVGSSAQFQINSSGQVASGTWQGSVVGLTYGGTNAALTADNGAIPYSSGSAIALLASTATAGKALISGASSAPSWWTPTQNSVVFIGASGILSQNNSNFTWNNSTSCLRLGTATSTNANLTIRGNWSGIGTGYTQDGLALQFFGGNSGVDSVSSGAIAFGSDGGNCYLILGTITAGGTLKQKGRLRDDGILELNSGLVVGRIADPTYTLEVGSTGQFAINSVGNLALGMWTAGVSQQANIVTFTQTLLADYCTIYASYIEYAAGVSLELSSGSTLMVL